MNKPEVAARIHDSLRNLIIGAFNMEKLQRDTDTWAIGTVSQTKG